MPAVDVPVTGYRVSPAFGAAIRAATRDRNIAPAAAWGSVNLILCCSGELTSKFLHEADRSREIITVVAREFFDIGAGVPDAACVPVSLDA